MKISVVVPSYNQAKFLKECIDSILVQQGAESEVLVFDGGSKDDSVEILKSYGSRIFWKSGKDRGQTDAINQGLLKATGDILAYLNSDDIYYKGALERVIRHFTESPKSKIVYGNCNHIHENGEFMEPYECQPWDYDKLLYVCYICQPGTFWRREVIERYGLFNDRLNYCMDYEYWLRVGKHIPFSYIDDRVLAGSRLYEGNKTLGKKIPVHQEITTVLSNHNSDAGFHWLTHTAHLHGEDKIGVTREDENFMKNYSYFLVKNILNFGEELDFPFNKKHITELENHLGPYSL